MNAVNELLGIQFNIEKAEVTDKKVQNLASYLNIDVLRAVHKQMNGKKAVGVDKVSFSTLFDADFVELNKGDFAAI